MRSFLLFLFSHRFLALARWEAHFIRLRFINALSLQSLRIRSFLLRCDRPRFLNLGSGPRGLDSPNWVNIDGFRDSNVHFLSDISRGLPFPDATFDGVFCEHVFEHFSLEDGERLSGEILRLLRPGGVVRIIVPDSELIMRRYFDDPGGLKAHRGSPNQTAMEVVNSYFRQRYEHQFLYDWETLEKILRCAKFMNVYRCAYQAGHGPEALWLDDEKYAWESLYVEAAKLC